MEHDPTSRLSHHLSRELTYDNFWHKWRELEGKSGILYYETQWDEAGQGYAFLRTQVYTAAEMDKLRAEPCLKHMRASLFKAIENAMMNQDPTRDIWMLFVDVNETDPGGKFVFISHKLE
jgi:hypothetical protein